MSDPLSPQDLAVRREILRALARDVAVTRVSVMQALGCEYAEVASSYTRLAATHVVVLDADTGEVWMALPFSAVTGDGRAALVAAIRDLIDTYGQRPKADMHETK